MQTKRAKQSGKILVNVSTLVFDAVEKRMELIALRRDAFLKRVLACEVAHLRDEVKVANSGNARKCIEDHLNLLDRRRVNLMLGVDTVQAIDEACREKNIPRDAFINRVLFCLAASPAMLDAIFGLDDACKERVAQEWDVLSLATLSTPLRAMEETVSDPFWFIRACMEVAREQSDDDSWTFYQAPIPDEFLSKPGTKTKVRGTLGFNVHLPDILIPGNPATRELLGFDELDMELKALQRNQKGEEQ